MVSINLENFIPGLVIGFILALLLDLSKPPKNKTNKKNLSTGKPQFAVSNNNDQELKMGKSFTFNWVRQRFGEEDDDDDDKPIIVRDVSDRFALKMPYLSKDLTHSIPLNVPPNWGMESNGSRRL